MREGASGFDTVWNQLAGSHGRRAVMSLEIDEATLDAETARQIEVIMPIVERLGGAIGSRVLDFGAGACRFTEALGQATCGLVTAYDPCSALLQSASTHGWPTPHCRVSAPPRTFFRIEQAFPKKFDLIFVFCVLGSPGLDLDATAAGLASILDVNRVLILADIMPDEPGPARWWRRRSAAEYVAAFAPHGIALAVEGRDHQLEDPITILAGRKAAPAHG